MCVAKTEQQLCFFPADVMWKRSCFDQLVLPGNKTPTSFSVIFPTIERHSKKHFVGKKLADTVASQSIFDANDLLLLNLS
jgi:hypothetical protein